MADLVWIKGAITRLVLVIHATVSVWSVVETKGGNCWYWLLAWPNMLLACEGVVGLCRRGKPEIKWFSPGILFYLLAIVPSIWVLELDSSARKSTGVRPTYTSSHLAHIHRLQITTGIKNNILGPQMWAPILEQLLLVVLIIGSWLLPTTSSPGNFSRGRPCQLVLVEVATAADILELLQFLHEDAAVNDYRLTYTILGVWSCSLLQYTLLTTAHASKPQSHSAGRDPTTTEANTIIMMKIYTFLGNSIGSDVVAALTTLLLHDGPFLFLRLIFIGCYRTIQRLNLLFTGKNLVVTCYLLYRLVIFAMKKRHIHPTGTRVNDNLVADNTTNKMKEVVIQDPRTDELWCQFLQWRAEKRERSCSADECRIPSLLSESRQMTVGAAGSERSRRSLPHYSEENATENVWVRPNRPRRNVSSHRLQRVSPLHSSASTCIRWQPHLSNRLETTRREGRLVPVPSYFIADIPVGWDRQLLSTGEGDENGLESYV